MIVVSNRISVAKGQEAAFERRFAGPNVFEMHEVTQVAARPPASATAGPGPPGSPGAEGARRPPSP